MRRDVIRSEIFCSKSWDIVHRGAVLRVDIEPTDHSQLAPLHEYLRLGAPDVRTTRTSAQPSRGEQGVLDILTLVASSSSLIAAIKVLPEFLRSRRSSVSITITAKEKKITLTATNIEEVMPVLEKLLDE
jgi:hypothetical protein